MTLDSQNETGTGSRPDVASAGGGAPAQSRPEIVVDGWLRELPPVDDALLGAYPKTLGAYRSAMAAVTSPFETIAVWTACPTRHTNEAGVSSSHVMFVGTMASVWCHACRLERPRFLIKTNGVVVHDSHREVPASDDPLGHVPSSFASGWEFPQPDLSPDAHGPRADGAGAESSASDLVGGPAPREVGGSPSPTAAEAASFPQDVAPCTILPPDDPKATVADFAPVQHPTPIGRAWLGLWEWKEWCGERAAIIEYDANRPRPQAERAARTLAGSAPR